MVSRRQVRQATIQLLYARSSSPKEQGGPELWDLIHDRTGLNYDRARIKILTHLQQGRETTAAQLLKLLGDNAAAILAADPTEKLARELKEQVTGETKWAERCANLSRLLKADTGGWRRDLHTLLPESATLKNQRETLLKKISSTPLQQPELKKNFEKLSAYDERVRMIHFPENYPSQRDLDPLHRLTSQMKTLESEAITLANQVQASIPELDELINQTTENFDITRLSKVDLTILRLATWELLKAPSIDAPVSINEAIDLARSFSGEDSATFVNGILDKIAKTTNT